MPIEPILQGLRTAARCHRALLATSSAYRSSCQVLGHFIATGTWDLGQSEHDHSWGGY